MTDPTTPPFAELRELAFAYAGGPPLFSGLSARIGAGVTVLDGDMGCGKTTLLRLLAGELRAPAGMVRVGGRAPGDDPAADAREIAWVDPHDEALDALTPAGVLAALAARHGGPDAATWARQVEGFALGPHLGKTMFQLSRGSRRKVGLAALFSLAAPLVLLDEPTAGLDAASIAWFARTLADAARAAPRAFVLASAHGVEDVPATVIALDAA